MSNLVKSCTVESLTVCTDVCLQTALSSCWRDPKLMLASRSVTESTPKRSLASEPHVTSPGLQLARPVRVTRHGQEFDWPGCNITLAGCVRVGVKELRLSLVHPPANPPGHGPDCLLPAQAACSENISVIGCKISKCQAAATI